LRVAVVGLGKMGLLHAGILNVLPSVELVALCDKSVLLRRFLKKVFKKIRVVGDLEELSDLDLDAVYVATPISSHFSVVQNAYLKKIARNLFVEKTLASSYDEAEKLCQLANRFGGVNMVGYVRRFGVTYREAKSLLVREVLGELISFEAYGYSSDFLGVEDTSRVSAARGGVLRDLGCHVTDLALWFFGDLQVDSVDSMSATGGGFEDSVRFTVAQSGGFEGQFDVSWCMDGYRMSEAGLLITGSKGIIEVNDDKVELKLSNGKLSVQRRHDLDDHVGFWLGSPEFFREDEYFVKSVTEGGVAEPSFLSASKVDRIIDQVKRKVDNGDQ
jgi:predicted dehydrogenase